MFPSCSTKLWCIPFFFQTIYFFFLHWGLRVPRPWDQEFMNTFFFLQKKHTQRYPPTQVPLEKRSKETRNQANSFLWANTLGLPRWLSGKEFTYRRHRRGRFHPWVGKIPWSRRRQLALVFLPEKSHGQRSLVSCSLKGPKESSTTEQLFCTTDTHCCRLAYLLIEKGEKKSMADSLLQITWLCLVLF